MSSTAIPEARKQTTKKTKQKKNIIVILHRSEGVQLCLLTWGKRKNKNKKRAGDTHTFTHAVKTRDTNWNDIKSFPQRKNKKETNIKTNKITHSLRVDGRI